MKNESRIFTVGLLIGGLLIGLVISISLYYVSVTVETDYYAIFQALNSLSENRSRLALQVKETRTLADEHQETEFVLTKREHNKCRCFESGSSTY